METINTKVKKWGNSFGIILPAEIVKHNKIKEGSNIEVRITAKNKTRAGDIFGILKGKLARDTDDLLKEVDRDFEKNE
ncbi:MAG: AbrB/MazE/SpoVT family DNA-binding domain-containing protein [Candidatus Nanoarchaeia archaeon]|nr:AbrB/MazE/SpoVT family DNA-binding domain-containing protein [Candidatus Nanoarchaeia archaeon]MDD5741540.1 AbrB/MazE/SpoVT family DNA-binding domain-containing protein [Candidatus Nanoarchaeia archaeon]